MSEHDPEAEVPAIDWTETAQKLADARLSDTKIHEPLRPEPGNTDQAYELQMAMIEAVGKKVVGWKVGATNPAAQLALGAKEPFVGPIFEDLCSESPCDVPSPTDALRVTEAEFAFRLGTDLPPRGAAYGMDEVSRAIESVHPAVEIVNKRLLPPASEAINWVIADGGANHAFVYGKGTKDLASVDLSSHTVRVQVNGTHRAEGSAANVMGSPVMVLAWLATHLSNRGIGLKAGDWVSTGLTTPVFSTAIGDEVIADFGQLGNVTLKLV